MATIRLKFRKSKKNNQKGACFVQLIHQRKMTTMATGFKLYEYEWDNKKERVSFRKATPERAKELLFIQEQLCKVVTQLDNIVMDLVSKHIDFTVDMLVLRYKTLGRCQSFFTLMEYRINQLEKTGQKRTAMNYRGTYRIFKAFRAGRDISTQDMTSLLIHEFEIYLKGRKNSLNTISYYMRILRAVYNYASKKKWIEGDVDLFQNVFTGEEKTAKRAIGDDILNKLINLDVKSCPALELTQDIFLFSIYTRGMSFIDIAYLTKSNLNGNALVYKRHKTGQSIRVTLPNYALIIIKKYEERMQGVDWVFPLLFHPGRKKRIIYSTALRVYNLHLEKISNKLHLDIALTSYVSRHTWASLAKKNGVQTHIISEAMGHTSETTTRIYLASLNNYALDKANDIVVGSMAKFYKKKT